MDNKPLSAKDRKQLEKRRREKSKQAQQYHKQQAKKSSAKKKSHSKIEEAVNSRKRDKVTYKSREEKYIKESNEKIRNLKPQDYDDGYYVDEFGEKQKRNRRAKEIRRQEKEVIYRRKKPVTPKQLKRRRILIYSGIFVVVLAIGIILSLTVLFKTEKIAVEGDKYYYEEQITAFSGVKLQENIFMAAMNGTPESIVENLPYVESASIGFSIPDTVTIKIENAVPSYVIKDGDKLLVVSAKGRILERIDKNTDKLPVLKCGKLKSNEIGAYVSFDDKNIPEILEDVATSIEKNEFEKIIGFDVTDTSNITLDYDGRIMINIGLPEDIDYKIRTAMTIINKKLDPNNTGTVAGTLDVSNCNTTKMSHYKPAETTAPVTTSPPATTAPEYTDDPYVWSPEDTYSDDYYSGDSYSDDTYSDDTYSDDTYSDGGYYDDTYSDDTYYGE